jgi:glutamate-1-semialdehyde aminotransferase
MRSNLDLVEQGIIWIQNYDVVPDVVVMGKGMGGGMPVGAFTASSEMMDLLSDNPKLGHITLDTLSLRQHVSLHCKKLLKPISWRKQLKGNPFKSLLYIL